MINCFIQKMLSSWLNNHLFLRQISLEKLCPSFRQLLKTLFLLISKNKIQEKLINTWLNSKDVFCIISGSNWKRVCYFDFILHFLYCNKSATLTFFKAIQSSKRISVCLHFSHSDFCFDNFFHKEFCILQRKKLNSFK